MKVLFTTFAAKSHLYALVPMAWALQTEGHEVRLASQPDLMDEVTRTGLTAVPVGQPLELEDRILEVDESEQENVPAETDPERLTWDYLHGVFSAMTQYVYQPFNPPDMVDDLVGFARGWRPDLVVWDPLTFAGAIAARVCGAAHARQLFALDLQGIMRSAFRAQLDALPPAERDDPLGGWLDETLRRYGGRFDEEIVLGQATLHVSPPSLMLPLDLPYVPVRYVPYNGPAVVPAWLQKPPPARKRVCLTLGISHRDVQRGDKTSIEDIIAAVADLDIEVVATLDARQLEALRELPDNVRVTDHVPLNALLPTCAAIVSHGGSGSFHTAAVHGVPQVIVPAGMWDERIKARRLAAAGGGICVEELTADGLRGCLSQVLDDPSYARGADRLRMEMRATPAPNAVVATLEKLSA